MSTVYAESGIEQEINRLLGILDVGVHPFVQVLIALAVSFSFLYFFWGLADYVRKDNATLDNAKKRMVWGVLGIFVLVSIWGIIYFLQNSILGGSYNEADIEFIGLRSAIHTTYVQNLI